jgi:glycerol uptake facilitator-like aquaporin
MLGAVFAAMSVQWTIARAVSESLIKDHLPFIRTAKGGATKRAAFAARSEAIIGALLVLGALVLIGTNYEQVREINYFAIALVVQSLPFLAATAIAALERSPLNEPLVWRDLATRFALGNLLPRRATATVQASGVTEERINAAP